jgi:hypothetical protein
MPNSNLSPSPSPRARVSLRRARRAVRAPRSPVSAVHTENPLLHVTGSGARKDPPERVPRAASARPFAALLLLYKRPVRSTAGALDGGTSALSSGVSVAGVQPVVVANPLRAAAR